MVGSGCTDIDVTGNSGSDVCNSVVAKSLVVEADTSHSAGGKEKGKHQCKCWCHT